ncbi:MAG: helix-turn-helix domain-containing protein [Bacillota bacterium]
MKPKEFGHLLKALRQKSIDHSGNRWTRENLSKRVNLTEDQLGRLERGERKYLDNQTLKLLADSFNLTNLEKKEFFYAASGFADHELFSGDEPESQLQALLREIEGILVPAFVIDAYCDFVAVNTAALNLFVLTSEILNYAAKIPAGYNILNFIYSPQFGCKEIFGVSWSRIATIEVLLFRRSSLRYRHTDYFKYILNTLLKEDQFNIDWYSSHIYESHHELTYEPFKYWHPHYGPLSYIAAETIINTKKGHLYLVLYNPTDNETMKVFSDLTGQNNNLVYRISSWPEKSW